MRRGTWSHIVALVGRASAGAPWTVSLRTASLRCNSITEHLLYPIVERLRSRPARASQSKEPAESSRLEALAATHYKFYGRGRSSLLQSERVVEMLMEPDLYQARLRLFGLTLWKRAAHAHLTMLTESELICIHEDESQVWLRGAAHGAISTYIPLRLIAGIDAAPIAPGRDSHIRLTLTLEDGLQIALLFASSRMANVAGLVRALRLARAGAPATSGGQRPLSRTS